MMPITVWKWEEKQPSGRWKRLSWAMTEYLIKKGRVGCVPGGDFGSTGEGYVRLCFARDRAELTGALDQIGQLLAK